MRRSERRMIPQGSKSIGFFEMREYIFMQYKPNHDLVITLSIP